MKKEKKRRSFPEYYQSDDYKKLIFKESKKGNYLIPLVWGLSEKVSKDIFLSYWKLV